MAWLYFLVTDCLGKMTIFALSNISAYVHPPSWLQWCIKKGWHLQKHSYWLILTRPGEGQKNWFCPDAHFRYLLDIIET